MHDRGARCLNGFAGRVANWAAPVRLSYRRLGWRARLPLPAIPTPAGPAAVTDLLTAMDNGQTTLAGLDCARRATEIGFAVHQSDRAGGRRVSPADIDRELRIASLPWGNE